MQYLRKFYRILLIALVCFSLSTAVSQAQEGGNLSDSVQAAELDPGFAIEWIQTLYDRIQVDGVNAPAAARLYGYAAVTLYESVLPGMPDNRSLAGQINGLTELPQPTEDAVYDWDAAADAAMFTVLSGLFSDSAESVQTFSDLRDQHLADRETATSSAIVERSVAFGDALGQALLDWISTDGYAERVTDYTPPTDDPSTWVPTREGQQFVEPGWGSIRPLAMENADVCAVLPDVPFSADPNSTFYAQELETMTVGQHLTDEQRAIAEYWVDTPGLSGTPSGHWMRIVGVLIPQESLMLDRAAELYAMVGISAMDSFIAAWSMKYQHPIIRPETYIHEYIRRSWQPYIQTPGFPEYPSGHSVVSAAAATVLTSYFGGPRSFTIDNITPSGYAVRSFTSFWAAANEAAISRLYGGIHIRLGIEGGIEMGRRVGDYVVTHIHLKPIQQAE